MNDGFKVTIGGAEYVVPRLNLKALKEHGARLKALRTLGDLPEPEQVDDIAAVIHAAMRRNYPDMSVEWLLDNVDLGNLKSIFDSLMGASGLVKAGAPGEAVTPAA